MDGFFATMMPFACVPNLTHPLLTDESIFCHVPAAYVEVMTLCLRFACVFLPYFMSLGEVSLSALIAELFS